MKQQWQIVHSIHTAISKYLAAILLSTYCLLIQGCFLQQEPLQIDIQPRTPEQMSAFYEARGFPQAMIDALETTCYMTVHIKNTSQDVLWLDLSLWRFTIGDISLKRFHRNEWLQRWKEMDIPLRFQSTFRWTLIPELLDYQPGEEEGGNIILKRTQEPITLHAVFPIGQDKQGKAHTVKIDNLRCAENLP
ncbi:MAG: hypothetical protein V3W04_04355 [Gammaproteobacteria bacterium]